MGKYDHLKFLKRTKARNEHRCSLCGQIISISEFYYLEKIKNQFLHSLHRNKFCDSCYQKYGDKLLQNK